MARISFEEMTATQAVEPSTVIRAHVQAARERQRARLSANGIACNAEIAAVDVRTLCALYTSSMKLLEAGMTRGLVSARAFKRVARVARTIADLDSADAIGRAHVAEELLQRSVIRAVRRPLLPNRSLIVEGASQPKRFKIRRAWRSHNRHSSNLAARSG